MTEPTPDAEVMQDISSTQPEPEPDDDVDDEEVVDMAVVRKIRREAASLRTRLHESEADRERLVSQLDAAQHRDVEREAAGYLVDPADVWRHTDADTQRSFVDEQFNEVIGDRVAEAAQAIIASKPHLARPQSAPPPTNRPIEGLRGGASPEVKPKPVTWSSALRGQ